MNTISGKSTPWYDFYKAQLASQSRASSADESKDEALAALQAEQGETDVTPWEESLEYDSSFSGSGGADFLRGAMPHTLSRQTGAAESTASSWHAGASALMDKLNGLMSDGTITEDEKEELLSALEEIGMSRPKRPPMPPEMVKSLDSLVHAGTITGQQEDAVISAVEESGAGSLEELVDDGTLTQEQMDAVSSAFQGAAKMKHAQAAYGAVKSLMNGE